MTRLTISLLGPFQVKLDGEPVTDFATDKTRALLAYLAFEARYPHRRDALAGLLWSDQPQQKARQNLRKTLSYLRAAIGDRATDDNPDATIADGEMPFLLVSRETVQFNPDSDYWLDAVIFKDLAATCQSHHHRRLETCRACMWRMEQMVDLYQGSFLDEFSLSDSSLFEEWALLQREWFHCEVTEALSLLADYYERRGDYRQARRYIRQRVALEPWHEDAHYQLMRLLALDGQRSAALAQYETCRRALTEELGVEPMTETTALYKQISESANPRIEELATCRLTNLPPSANPFVGREEELAALADMLANPNCRLVNLLGPGGIGKTRLALQVAAEQVGAFAHGVYFVSLASVSSTKLVASTMADALGIPFQGQENTEKQLLGYLHGKEMLLVLDNLEHLLSVYPVPSEESDITTLLATILQRAPRVVLLVTSRERINLHEEWAYEVRGLAYPEDVALHVEALATYQAIQLFVQSAQRISQRFALTETEAPGVIRICQLTEGVPLGIELAAAWVRSRSCTVIADEIRSNLDVLSSRLRNVPARHQSIRATFEHSWQLLTAEEQRTLAGLSVFRGGFCKEAAAHVAKTSSGTLIALLDKSLVSQVAPDRYSLHALLGQYAAEKLQADPKACARIQARHRHYFAGFLERQAAHLRGPQQKQILAEIASEIENARQAWQWAVAGDDWHEIDQSLDSLYYFFDVQGRFQEGIDLFAQVRNHCHDLQEHEAICGRILSRQGALFSRMGLYEEAQRALKQGLHISTHYEATEERAFSLAQLANIARHYGDYQETERLAQEAMALARQSGASWHIAHALFLLGIARYRIGEIASAEALLEDSLAVGREIGDLRLQMSALNTLGDVACHQGDFVKGRTAFEACLALSRELGDQYNGAIHLNNLGTLLHELKEYETAQSLYQESLNICCQIGDQTGQAIALSNLGRVAHERGAYSQAMTFYRKGLAIGRNLQDRWTIIACLDNLGRTACAMVDYEVARNCLREAIQLAQEAQAVTVLLEILVDAAVLLARQGKPARAAGLFELAHHHPACERVVQERAARLLSEIGLVPSANLPEQLDDLVAEVLAEF